jgi:hypothetical protein
MMAVNMVEEQKKLYKVVSALRTALYMRVIHVKCPECDVFIEPGSSHQSSCVYYYVEEKTVEALNL